MKTVSLNPALARHFSRLPYILVYSVYIDARVLPECFYCVCGMPSHEISRSVMFSHEISRSATLLTLLERAGGAEAAW